MRNYWKIVKKVIGKSDVILILLDSRMVPESRNKDIEANVIATGKPFIYVLTKCDLISKAESEVLKRDFNPCVFVSATKYHGLNLLRERINILATRAHIKRAKTRVGVLGYPNVGKSSLINAMTGRSSAQTSIVSGHTKAMKYVAVENLLFVDTPGIIPLGERGDIANALIGAVDFSKETDPDLVVMLLFDRFPGRLEKFYGVETDEDREVIIERVALKRNIIKRGGVADIKRASVMILKDWQTGKIK
jgi:ribosome biogenesis GTPase A